MELREFTADLLANDAGAAGRARLMDELALMEHTVKRRLDTGLVQDEAVKTRAVAGAIEAAKQIVDQSWDTQYN